MPINWPLLQSACIVARLPEPELRQKMWVYVIDIPDHFNTCDRSAYHATETAIRWCLGYQKENNAE